jgi:hypothetical protein
MTIGINSMPDATQDPLDDEEILTLTRIAREAGIGPVELVRRTAQERIAAEATR